MKILTINEHHLQLKADSSRLKIIAEALGEYMNKYPSVCDDTTLSDFKFNMETTYQAYHNLDEDDWGFASRDIDSESYMNNL
tara:strand:+ start:3113 stop:3358 length:246 start_codon:yes stop_codon:yes gene_type:complete